MQPEAEPQLEPDGDVGSQASLAPQVHTQPDLLPMLDFEEYQVIYGKWEAGSLDLEHIRRQYGSEVAELIQAQRAVSIAADDSILQAEAEQVAPTLQDQTPLGSSNGVQGLPAPAAPGPLSSQGSLGSPCCCFGIFEQVYGEWKDGHRSDHQVEQQYGRDWIRLFRVWRQWGLGAIWSFLDNILDMRADLGEGQPGLLIQARDTLGERIRIPFLVVRAHFDQWCQGSLGDEQLQTIYGDHWLVLFRRWRTEGLQAVRPELEEHVEWGSAEWLFKQGST